MARPAREFRLLPCSLPGLQMVQADTRHHFPKHIHENFGIGLIHRGAQKSLSGRGTVEAGPGQVITVNPGEVHDGRPIGDNGRFWSMLYLTPAAVAQATADLGLSGEVEFIEPVLSHPGLAQQLAWVFAADGIAFGPEEHLLLLLAGMLRPRAAKPMPMSAGLYRVREMLEDDPGAPLLLADLAAAADLSRFQVVRGFARLTGLTPHAYLIQRRLQHARALITGGMALAEVAAAAGFADQSHLTRLFIRQYGFSPGAFARARV